MGVTVDPKALEKVRSKGGCLPGPHDRLTHYSGCLRYSERDDYLQSATESLRGEIDHLLSRINKVRAEVDARPEGEFWSVRLADHLADFRSKPQPRKSERFAATLSRLHLGSRETRLNIPAVRKTTSTSNIAEALAAAEAEASASPRQHEYKGLHAGAVYFKKGLGHSQPKLKGSFPNQTVPLVDLLSMEEGKSLLSEPCEEGMLRWFHIPANNMVWVEEAIARHFGEERPQKGDLFDKPKKSPKTYNVLRHVGWRGHSREVDGHAPAHTRQLEPCCEVVRAGPGRPKAMVMFTPYLHWETAQGWEQQSRSIDRATRSAILQHASAEVRDRVEDNFHNELRGHGVNDLSLSAVAREAIASSTSHFRKMTMRASTRRGVIGRILFCAARIAKVMTSFEDDGLVGDFLFANPPLHPRRTLHQVFNEYSDFLRDTRKLDQEQIVYKATAGARDPSRPRCNKWCQCSDCATERATIPRLIMVDQLWLFVLDENTIISSFPQRWGSYFSEDPSGVYSRIRRRLEEDPGQEFGSPYDLVLTIFDTCCRVFWENLIFEDRQPLMNYIFSDSINFVTTRELAARQELGVLAQKIWNVHNSPDKAQIAEAHKAIMNINPEAGLLRQVDNILSDLRIIRRIKTTQQKVLERYHINVARLLVPKHGLHVNIESHSPALRDVKRMREAFDDDETVPAETKAQATWTLSLADDSEVLLADQYKQINSLFAAATHCHQRLENLLDTKNRYAGIISAWEAVANSVEQANQGKSITLFSVLSIIFLPLSFITSIFGMNIQDYRIGVGTLAQELYYVFFISILVIFFSLLLAFDKFSLALLLYCINVPFKWVSTRIAMWQPAALQRMTNYQRLNEERLRKMRQMEDEIRRVRLVNDTKMFWKEVEAEQARRRAEAKAAAKAAKREGRDATLAV